jgi:threonine dehydratase
MTPEELVSVDEVRDASRVLEAHLERTPCLPSPWLSDIARTPVFVKWESQQITGSFKLRGALFKLMRLRQRGATAVLAVSAGNHGLGVAWAARAVGVRATVVVAENAVKEKVDAIRDLGAEVIVRGADYDAAEPAARALAEQRGLDFVSPYNDPEVIAGQASVAVEMLAQAKLDLILVPVGGGGLLAGTALVAARRRPDMAVLGVQPVAAAAMHAALVAGEIVPTPQGPTLADGLAGNLEDSALSFQIIKRTVREVLLVDEEAIERAIVGFLRHEHQIVEGSGAVAAAALFGGDPRFARRRIGVIVTGRNLDLPRLRAILDRA